MANKRTGTIVKCPKCGTETYKAAYQINRGERFCSKECRYSYPREYQRHGEMLNCKVCGKPFYRKRSEIDRGIGATCSYECRRQWYVGERNHFSNQFPPLPPRPKKWTRQQRREWLAPQCARCGSTENLELDHIVPRGPHTKENTQTLCRSCNQRKCWAEDRVHYQSTYAPAKQSPPA